MWKWLLPVLLFFAGTQLCLAQRDMEGLEEPSFKDRIYFGGGGNLQLTDAYFVVGVSPLVGYMISQRLSAGVGITYQYTSFRRWDLTAHTYGGRLFSRYNIFPSIYAMAEYESLNMPYTVSGPAGSELRRTWTERFLVGGGYFQSFGGNRGGFNIGILYDLFFQYNNPSSPYTSPWVYRVGFTF